jgi:polyisoprenoid-binding protein YceI
MNALRTLLVLGILSQYFLAGAQTIFECRKGKVTFTSTAPQEIITASTSSMKGLLNVEENSFVFSVDMKTFQGFNSDLQREHFNESYMETEKFPKAYFTGKLIDKFDTSLPTQTIRAKGQLSVHGILRERIIPVNISRKGELYLLSAKFDIGLADHGIKVPKIVHQKIAEVINVEVTSEITTR